MLISSERGTGEIVSPTDDTRFYDDVACLAADWVQAGEEVVGDVLADHDDVGSSLVLLR